MSSALTPAAADPASNPVMGPDGGDPRSAASVRVPMTTLLNGIMWLRGVLTGTISQTVSLLAGFNGVYGSMSGNFDIQGIGLLRAGRVCPRIVTGDTTTGVHTYSPNDCNYVLTDGFTPAVQASCVWRILDIGFENELMTFSTWDAITPITLQNPAGSTLATLKADIGDTYEVTCRFSSGNWTVVQRRFR